MTGWVLAIDFGTTSTAAARRVRDRVDLVQLHGAPRIPSAAFWREADEGHTTGRLLIGGEAEDRASIAPWCLERNPKERLGEEFIQLGDKQMRPVEIVAAIYREFLDEAIRLSGGEPPAEVRLTHPARWGKALQERLRRAAALAGIENPTLIPEPVAAAIHFASSRLADGEHVAVYDLGGGTLDTAVLKRAGSTFEVIGRPGGNEELGGEDFDDDVFRFLGEQLDGEKWERIRSADERRDRNWGQAARTLRRQARAAKERLSTRPVYDFYLPPPVDQELQITVADFEALVSPALRGTVAELDRTILDAGLDSSQMASIYLAGGSSRIPLVSRLIREELAVVPEHLDDPKAVIALGAAKLPRADERSGDEPTEVPTAPTPPSAPTEPGPTPPATPKPPAPPEPPKPPDPPRPDPIRTPPKGGEKPKRRGRIIAAVVALVVLVGGGVAAALLLGGGSDEPSGPEFPGPEELGGEIDGGGRIRILTNEEGGVETVLTGWEADCTGEFEGGTDRQETRFIDVTAEDDGSFTGEKSYTRRTTEGYDTNFSATISGQRNDDGQFSGEFSAGSRYTEDGSDLGGCETGTVSWATDPSVSPSFPKFRNP